LEVDDDERGDRVERGDRHAAAWHARRASRRDARLRCSRVALRPAPPRRHGRCLGGSRMFCRQSSALIAKDGESPHASSAERTRCEPPPPGTRQPSLRTAAVREQNIRDLANARQARGRGSAESGASAVARTHYPARLTGSPGRPAQAWTVATTRSGSADSRPSRAAARLRVTHHSPRAHSTRSAARSKNV
jgi:hypothetical protein